jgi:hypothetical protein
MIEQATQAALGAYGSWNQLSVLIVGESFEREGEYLLSKGVRQDNLKSVPIETMAPTLSEQHFDILLIKIPRAIPYTGSLSEYLDTLHQLRDTVTKPRVMVVESEILGFDGRPDYGDPETSLKQIYLEILKSLETQLGDAYINFHEQLLQEVRDEDYEKRLCYIFRHDLVKPVCSDRPEIVALFTQAMLRTLAQDHSSRAFEAGFISGSQKEKAALLKVLRPNAKWEDYSSRFPKGDDELLRCQNISNAEIDPAGAEIECQIWDDLEEIAGRHFDYLGKKTFNRLSDIEKFRMTGDDQFKSEEKKDSQPDLTHNFRKFEVSSNPLGSLMGGNGLAAANPLAAGLNKPSLPLIKKEEGLVSLEEHGGTFLSMLAAWQRKAVIVGGALFEYNYQEEDGLILGSVIALSREEKLLTHVDKLAKAIALDGSKKDAKAMLKAFFDFNKTYIKFYDKVRSQLKTSFDQNLGHITKEDYDREREREASLESGVKVDMKARKEREKKLSELSKSSMKARHELLKKLKDDRSKDQEVNGDVSSEELEVQVATIELSMTEDEIENINKSLEQKRLQLENKLEVQTQKRKELEEAILKEQSIRDEKRQELEKQRLKKIEAEKAEFTRRQQRLAEERKKREEVKRMRAKSLREAFDRAREAAMRKQESKGGKDDNRPKDKKVEKKKYNPEAVKMMIRFGTDDRKIMSTTGISGDDLTELREAVTKEDSEI